MFRHLPPTAAPLSWSQWAAGWQRPRPGLPPRSPSFATQLATYLGVPACFTAASGRTALYLLLASLQAAHPGRDQVLLPAYTCPSLVKVILDVGLQPRLVEMSPETLDYAPGRVAQALSKRTLALIYVHPFGLALPVTTLLDAVHAAGAVLIEDAAQALGARWQGQQVGTWGDFGLYSLGPGKPLSAGGGGIVSANRPELAAALAAAWEQLPAAPARASLLAQARLAAFQLAFTPAGWWLASKIGLHKVGNNEASWGYARRGLSRAQAQVGAALLPGLAASNARRLANAHRLMTILAADERLTWPRPGTGAEPFYLRLPVLAANEAQREQLHHTLWSAGIGVGRMYERTLAGWFPQLASHPFPGAEAIAGRLLTLPTHHYLADADFDRVAAALSRSAGG
ncbi:MAG: DegT/DnrJ/EryC1/StrS aminotransferase family protein [Anaerolineales bacterium]|nr:DegT/DnrJ/EryC1/StrS aminotransferase family protein [Anaerolineales bacterium]